MSEKFRHCERCERMAAHKISVIENKDITGNGTHEYVFKSVCGICEKITITKRMLP